MEQRKFIVPRKVAVNEVVLTDLETGGNRHPLYFAAQGEFDASIGVLVQTDSEDESSDCAAEVSTNGAANSAQVNLYRCKECGKEYKQLMSLEKHKCPEQKTLKVPCPSCNKLISKSNISHHLKVHSQKKFKCLKCKMAFNNEVDLGKHDIKHLSVGETKCSKCNAKFSRPNHLKKHMKVHSEQLPGGKGSRVSSFKCKHCPETLATSSLLKKHYLDFHKDKSVKCLVCGKAFFSSNGIKDHLEQHSKINQAWLDDSSQAVVSKQSCHSSAGVVENSSNMEYVVISSVEVSPGEEVTTIELPAVLQINES